MFTAATHRSDVVFFTTQMTTTTMMIASMGLPLKGHNPDDHDHDDGGDGLTPTGP